MKADTLLKKIVENNKIVGAKIDSLCVTAGGNYASYVYNDIPLHELRSASKLVVAFAFGLVAEKRGGEFRV